MPAKVTVLSLLVEELNSGRIKVVDLSQPLGEDTVVIDLPPQFASSPGFTIEQISALRRPGARLVLEHHPHGRTHRHALRRAHPLDHRQGLRQQQHRHHSAASVRRPGLRHRRDQRGRTLRGFPAHPRACPRLGRRTRQNSARSVGVAAHGLVEAQGRDEFLNIKADGPHSPGWHKDCVQFLARERDVLGAGVETVGTDAGQAGTFDPPFPCHTFMHGAGKFGLASLRNLDQLPPTGAIVIAAPLKIVKGSGSPVRVLALVPEA